MMMEGKKNKKPNDPLHLNGGELQRRRPEIPAWINALLQRRELIQHAADVGWRWKIKRKKKQKLAVETVLELFQGAGSGNESDSFTCSFVSG